MAPHIVIPGKTPIGRCRVCKRPFFTESERTMARHVASCAREFYQRTQPERDALAFLKPADPELAAWAPKAYAQGRLKPSTERLI